MAAATEEDSCLRLYKPLHWEKGDQEQQKDLHLYLRWPFMRAQAQLQEYAPVIFGIQPLRELCGGSVLSNGAVSFNVSPACRAKMKRIFEVFF